MINIKYETAPNFIQLHKPKLYIGSFADLAEFPCFYQFLHDVIIKLFCFDLHNNSMFTSCKNWLNREIQLNQQTILCQVLANWIKFGYISLFRAWVSKDPKGAWHPWDCCTVNYCQQCMAPANFGNFTKCVWPFWQGWSNCLFAEKGQWNKNWFFGKFRKNCEILILQDIW